MNQAIRSSWAVAVVLMALILGSVTYVQFFAADSLKHNDLNTQSLLQAYCGQRGAIVAGGQAIAQSVPSGDSCAYVRQYVDGPLYAGLTGFFTQAFGASGLELAMNDQLTGQAPELFFDQIAQLLSGSQPKGSSVELTINPAIQKMAYDMIPDGTVGSIVVMNPKTGAIIAMVSKPSYDTNLLAGHNYPQVAQNFSTLTQDPNVNMYGSSAYRLTYSPGSIFKLVDTAAALSSGKYTKDSVLANPPSLTFPGTSVDLPNYVYGNCKLQTQADFAFALAQSCNTPFAQIALDLGQQAITDQATKFGFNTSGLSLPSMPVATSVFPGGKGGTLGQAELARSAIGQQNVQVTPLEVAMLTSAIANKGAQMKPQLVQGVRTPDLKPVSRYDFKPEQLRQSISPEVAQQLTDWMTGVVDNGIAHAAAVPGIKVAGKTGTAEGDLTNPSAPKNSWFTGFAPADDPQVVVSIMVQGADIVAGNQLTSPNASKLIKAVLNK
ncbi:peptidoglycan D,D-transpeptidase FtsI family protein [Psychromicrobium xiongbiense]|uniref:peptidoglycan D,D-transpeptidase FtsI family protein n=1 Tax=Psychromicrobium xiongbiense TaxID=3051184 RepID=UPI002553A616|nr:penicillin-binding transpeptidase domain-containing protein [Psychromicrobium sp. YIM S02556]